MSIVTKPGCVTLRRQARPDCHAGKRRRFVDLGDLLPIYRVAKLGQRANMIATSPAADGCTTERTGLDMEIGSPAGGALKHIGKVCGGRLEFGASRRVVHFSPCVATA